MGDCGGGDISSSGDCGGGGGDSSFSCSDGGGGGGGDFSCHAISTNGDHAISIFSTPHYKGTGFSPSSRNGRGGGKGTSCSICKVLGVLLGVAVSIGIVIVLVVISAR